MRYVGIDPSLSTGLLIIQDGRVQTEEEIKTKTAIEPERFMIIANHIIQHLQEGDIICIEGFSYGSKGRGVSTQYGMGWIIRAELKRNGYNYYEIAPGALKKFATGKGNTSKDEMVLPIYKRWGYEGKTDNIRDAFILAKIAEGLKNQDGLTAFQIDVIKNIKGGN